MIIVNYTIYSSKFWKCMAIVVWVIYNEISKYGNLNGDRVRLMEVTVK